MLCQYQDPIPCHSVPDPYHHSTTGEGGGEGERDIGREIERGREGGRKMKRGQGSAGGGLGSSFLGEVSSTC